MKRLIYVLAVALMAAAPAVMAQDDAAASAGDSAALRAELQQLQSQMNELQQKLDKVDAIVTDPEGKVETAIADLSKVKKVVVSGYAQVRYEWAEQKEDGGKFNDSFNVRRARVKVTATPTGTSSAVLQLDMGANKVTVKDAYITYTPKLGYTFQVGQQNWWFGYEVPYSSSRRETPERALIFRRLFDGERDRGAVLNFPMPASKTMTGTLGVYDGTGIHNSIGGDLDQSKDILARVLWNGPNMEFGASAYYGGYVLNSARTATVKQDKKRYGVDWRYYGENWTLKTEYIRGRGVDTAPGTTGNLNSWIDGGYAQINYNTDTTNTLVGRWSTMSTDPVKPVYGRRSSWDLGLVHWLDANQKLKVFYTINKEHSAKIKNNISRVEWVVTY